MSCRQVIKDWPLHAFVWTELITSSAFDEFVAPASAINASVCDLRIARRTKLRLNNDRFPFLG